jgi:uncharacterized protein YidB (DUF937 family)
MTTTTEVKQLIEQWDLSSLTERFRQSGLDKQVSSWIAKGQNLPVAGDQIERAPGSDTVASIAGKLGITQVEAADELAEAVPEVVDQKTPEGQIPASQPTAGQTPA